MFRRNVGGLDRAARLVAGAILLTAGLILGNGPHGYGLVIAIVGLAGLASGILGFCPPYLLFGFSTARAKEAPAEGGAHPAG
jgi:Inner membrane protein YgaP-like, transmembrane domain